MLISLSKVSRSVAADFTKILVLAAYGFDDEHKLGPNLIAKLKTWQSNGLSFVTSFGLDKTLYTSIVKSMIKGNTAYEDDALFELLEDFAKKLRVQTKKALGEEVSIERAELGLLKDFATVALASKAETADKAILRIKRNVSILGDLDLTQSLGTDVGTQSNTIDKLRVLTTKLGGKDIDIDQKIRSKFKGKQLLKDYNKLKGELNAVPRNFVMEFVRNSGKKYLPVRDVSDALSNAGIRHHTIATNFDGLIDDVLKYYTNEGKLLNGTPSGDVRMNSEYDPVTDNTYVFDCKPPMAQGYSRVYTFDHKSKNTKKKFEAVGNFDKKAVGIRKKWLAELRRDKLTTKNSTLALVAEIIFQTSGRVGSTGNVTAGSSTFGITTLQVGHYKVKGNNRLLDYPGKKAQQQKHSLVSNTLNTKLIISLLDKLTIGKKRKDNLITFNGRPITGNALNKYLSTIGMPRGVTVHKFRTLKGTKLARQILDASPFLTRKTKLNPIAVNKWVNSALLKVAKELGHFTNGKLTVATAIANYIDPSVLADFYKKLGIRMPANIEKVVNLIRD
jgi:DNA topoisomerase IB